MEPQSGIEQIGIGVHASSATLNIDVPADGQKKPAKTVAVTRFNRSQISVGAALNDTLDHTVPQDASGDLAYSRSRY
jgi:hypothetical protein